MAQPIGTRAIPSLADRDPERQQFFEEVKFRLDNLGSTGGGTPTDPGGGTTPPPTGGTGGTSSSSAALIGTGQVAAAIGAYMLVTTNDLGLLILADSANPSHIDRILGITTAASAPDGSVSFVAGGIIQNLDWTWLTNSKVFVGEGGLVTANPFTGVFSQIIGYAVSPTKIFISVNRGIMRS